MNTRNLSKLIRQLDSAKKQLANANVAVAAVTLELNNLATQSQAVGSGNAKVSTKPVVAKVAKTVSAKPTAKVSAKPTTKIAAAKAAQTTKPVAGKPTKIAAKTTNVKTAGTKPVAGKATKVAVATKPNVKTAKTTKVEPNGLKKAKPFPGNKS